LPRVIMVVNSDFRHDARVWKEALSLSRAGYGVTVFSLAMAGPREQYHEGIRLVNPAAGPLARFPYRPSYLRVYLQVITALLREKGDVWHGHDLETLPFVYLAARLRGGKVVYDAHELWQGYDWPGRGGGWNAVRRLVWKGWLHLEGALARRCDLVVTVNESCALAMAGALGIKPPPVIRNCADPVGEGGRPAAGLREVLGLVRGEPLVVYSGLLKKGRGLENLLQAWAGLPVEAHLAFVGRGPLESELRDLALAAGFGNVHFLPPVKAWELPGFIRGASLGVVLTGERNLNSRYSLPNKLFEYLAAGIPALASDLPEIRRLVKEYDAGVLVDPRDHNGIRLALTGLLDDREGRERLRKNAFRAGENLTWQGEVKRLIDEYSKITGKVLE